MDSYEKMSRKGEFQPSGLLIGLCIIAGFIVVLLSFISFGYQEFQGSELTDEQYNTLSTYNQLNNTNVFVRDVTNESNQFDVSSAGGDALGSFFTQQYQSFRLITQSTSFVADIADTAGNSSLFLGKDGQGRGTMNTLKTMGLTILGISFLFVLLTIVIKSRI